MRTSERRLRAIEPVLLPRRPNRRAAAIDAALAVALGTSLADLPDQALDRLEKFLAGWCAASSDPVPVEILRAVAAGEVVMPEPAPLPEP